MFLKEFRRSKGKTLREMGEFIGVSKSFYEKVEYGDVQASATFLRKFKKAFPDVDMNCFYEDQK